MRAVALRCRTWACPECAPDRLEDLKGLARRGEPKRFITLTSVRRDDSTPAEAARELRHAFVVLRRRAERMWGGKRFDFIAVFEATAAGWPHLHVLARCPYLSQRWISDAMRDLTGAFVVDVRAIDNPGRAAAYVSKYVSKAPARWQGCKRYWRSMTYELGRRGRGQDEARRPGAWVRESKILWRVVEDFRLQGFTFHTDGRAWIGIRGPP